MEVFLAVLMWLGIFVVGPFVFWFVVLGGLALAGRLRQARIPEAEPTESEFEAEVEARPAVEEGEHVAAGQRRG